VSPRTKPASDALAPEASTGRPRRRTPSRGRLKVRRPIAEPMPPERREQAISALAHLLIAQLEREAQPPGRDAGEPR
jgi:hypothetical protein